jgi:hypothetical protein|tara:strand:- start:59 stop:430 length:372 start_codon:yes stop_codon:yes gene_type:complete
MSLSAFSQSVTDTLKIPLPKVIVKEVIKDLIKGDASKKEVVVLNDIIAQKSIQLSTKDTIIISLNQKIINFGSIINTKDQQQSLNTQLVKDLEKALKRQKRRTFFYKVGTGIGAVVTLILLAK